MKKYLLIIGMAIMFMSCNKPSVEMVYDVTAEFTVWNVVSGFKDLAGEFLFENGELWIDDDDYEPILMFYIYDENGDLLSTENVNFTNFKEVPQLSIPLKEGNYTFVSVVYLKRISGQYDWWKIEGTEKLQNFTIEGCGTYYPTFMSGSILGVDSKRVQISKAENIKISVPAVTSLVAFNFTNLNYTNIETVVFSYKTKPDYFDVANDLGYNIKDVNWVSMEDEKTSYNNLIFYLNLFPTSEIFTSCECYDANGELVLSGDIPSYPIEPNKTTIITIDCVNGQVSMDTKAGVSYDENVMTLRNPAEKAIATK